MRNSSLWIAASLLAMTAAYPALAQTALTGVEALDDRIDEITDDVNDELAKGEDKERFGPLGVPQGWRGSLAVSANATSGNTDTGEVALAGRATYGVNTWTHSFGFAAEYGEANGVQNKEKLFGIYEGSRYFTEQFYMFGTGRAQYDNFATNKVDSFIGFGPGYRILNQPDIAWRVQAGPGVRYVEDQTGFDTTEFAGLAASRFYYKISDTAALTNDTDVLGSEINTVITNDLGLNLKVTETLAARFSYRVEYNTDPLPGLKSTDSSYGVSLVVGF